MQLAHLYLLLAFIILALLYLAPALIAYARRHANALPVALTTLLFGWTIVGWGIALIWSLTAQQNPAPGNAVARGVKYAVLTTVAIFIALLLFAGYLRMNEGVTQAPSAQTSAPAPVKPAVESGVPVPAEELFGD